MLAAEQAALAADRPARVVETRSIAAGLAAMVAYDPGADAERNAVAMAAAAAGVRCGEVTVAVRDAQVDGVAVRAGDYLALLDGTVVGAHGDAAAALQAVADALLADGGDVLTVLRGADGEALGPALEDAAGRRRGRPSRARDRRLRGRPAALSGAPVGRMTHLTAETTAIVLDSTADLPDARERFPGLRVVPLTVRFGDEEFRDYIDLGPDEFYRRLAAESVTPKTSQPSPEAFATVYQALFDEGYRHVISLHISGKLSGTVSSARLAAADWPGGITVIDSGTVSVGVALCAFGILDLLERGADEADLIAYSERFAAGSRIVVSVDTLEYLVRGGRIGKAAGMVGQLLSVRPILQIADGEVEPLTRVRGASKVLGALEREFDTAPADGPLRVAIASSPGQRPARPRRRDGRARPAARDARAARRRSAP